MTTFYSHNGAYPTILPNRIILSNGKSRTDKTTFTVEELADAGWVAVSNPPVAIWPNKLDWDGSDWVVRAPNESEIAERWREIKSRCLTLLVDTDYKVIKAYEAGVPVDTAIVQYRQGLRDLYNNVNNVDPWSFSWPTMPD
jgi:hypothetical protein